jgi:hypothetical protein
MCILALAIAAGAQETSTCKKDTSYENHNQIDYGPLQVQQITGIAKDPRGVALPKVCLFLFTENDHKLIASTATDDKGEFRIEPVAPGKYRLVAKYSWFCSANVPLMVKKRGDKSRTLVLHMRPPAVDTCSFGAFK